MAAAQILRFDQQHFMVRRESGAEAGPGDPPTDDQNIDIGHERLVTVWKAGPSRACDMMNFGFTEFLLVALAIILVVAAVIDVRTFTISNGLNLTVALMAPLYWWSIALPLWPDAAIQVGVALQYLVFQ